jgi:hypothetical protein
MHAVTGEDGWQLATWKDKRGTCLTRLIAVSFAFNRKTELFRAELKIAESIQPSKNHHVLTTGSHSEL